MKILYNQKQLKRSLILGLIWIAIGIGPLFFSQNQLTAFIGIGVMYVLVYFFQKNRPYVLITEEYIRVDHFPFGKKQMALDQIQTVKYFAGDYIIKDANKELVIDTNLVDKDSLAELKQFMQTYIQG